MIGCVVFLSALAVVGISRIETVTGFRTFLGEKDPQVAYLDDFLDRFGGGFPLLIAYGCDEDTPCKTVFDYDALQMVHDLRVELGALEGVRDVYTVADSELLVPTTDGFEVRKLYEASDLKELAVIAAVDPLWDGALTAQNGKVGAVVVQFSTSDARIQKSVTLRAREFLSKYEEQGYVFRLVGESVDFVVAPDAFNLETQKVMPFMVMIMIGVLSYLFRSVIAVVIAFTTMGLASLWSQGLMGLLGFPVDAMTQNVPTIVLVVGICTSVHVLSRYAEESRERSLETREERIAALLIVVRDIGKSCILTTLTTSVAFAAFLTSSFKSFQHFGLVSAAGVISALLLTFTLLPILVAGAKPNWIRSVRASEFWEDLTNSIVDVASGHAKVILGCAFTLMLLCSYGASLVVVETTHYSLLGRDNPVVHWAEWVEDNLRGPEGLEVELILPETESLDDPEALKVVGNVATFVETQFDGVGEVRSVLDPLQRVYFLLNGSVPEFDRLPDDEVALAEVYLFMPASMVENWLSLDRRHVRLSAEASSMPTRKQGKIVSRLEAYLDGNLPEGWTYGLTGSLPIFAAMMNTMLETQMKTFLLAFLGVWLCLLIYFKSLTVAVLGMFPNLLPVLLMLGTLGFWGIPMDVGMTMTAAIVLGLAVDDTIHLLVQYQRRARTGASPTEAMRGALSHVGRSVVTTSLALSLSFFGLMLLSSFEAIGNFGLMASVAIFAALIADLMIVPALVHTVPRLVLGEWATARKPICRETQAVSTIGD